MVDLSTRRYKIKLLYVPCRRNKNLIQSDLAKINHQPPRIVAFGGLSAGLGLSRL